MAADFTIGVPEGEFSSRVVLKRVLSRAPQPSDYPFCSSIARSNLILSPLEISRLSLGQEPGPQATPAPDIHSEGVVAVDITSEFSKAVQSESTE